LAVNEISQAGFRMEIILRRLGIGRGDRQYVDAKVLAKNLIKARSFAKNAVKREMEKRKKLSRLLHKSPKAKELYSRAFELDVNSDQQFIDFTILMLKVLSMLGIDEIDRS